MSKELSPIDEEGKLILEPVEIIDVWEKKLRSHIIKEFLMRWKDLLVDNATYEGKKIMEHFGFQFL